MENLGWYSLLLLFLCCSRKTQNPRFHMEDKFDSFACLIDRECLQF